VEKHHNILLGELLQDMQQATLSGIDMQQHPNSGHPHFGRMQVKFLP